MNFIELFKNIFVQKKRLPPFQTKEKEVLLSKRKRRKLPNSPHGRSWGESRKMNILELFARATLAAPWLFFFFISSLRVRMLVTSLVTKKKRLAAKNRPHTVSRRTASVQLGVQPDVQPDVQPAVQQGVQPAVKSIGQSFQLPGASPPQHKKRWAGAATDHNSLNLFRRFCLFEIFFVERRSGKAGVGSRS